MEEPLTEEQGWIRIFASTEEAFQLLSTGEMRLLEIEGLRICLARTKDGLRAITDDCPHLGASLSRGKCNFLGEVVCPWHSYRFNLTTGEETTRNGYQARTFLIVTNQEGVFLHIPDKVRR